MILIADSGSTKTEWCLADGQNSVSVFTQGINPFFQDDAEIVRILREELLPKLGEGSGAIHTVAFYGAGLREEMKPRMRSLLSQTLHAEQVTAESDLLGAARALFGRDQGIACILGTGSNSGLYDGKNIVANTPPLGFILGDEGSGAYLGKLFIGALCKGLMPKGMLEDFTLATGQDTATIIDQVYRKPMPNRYLAKTSKYILQHIQVKEVEQLVVYGFRQFFSRNLTQYHRKDLPVRAIGSVAFYYADFLVKAAGEEGYNLDVIEKNPMRGLIDFHAK